VRTGKIDLRKVLGEVNPADLFTKHSLSRERLKGLVTLFDCHFRSGRAESAPRMRTEVADKKTISDADLATVGERLIFPHLEYAKPELDRLYPPMAVPEAVDAGDPQQDEDDPILVEGYRLAGELVKACEEQGRKRRLEAYDATRSGDKAVQLATDTSTPDNLPLGTLTVGTDRSVGRSTYRTVSYHDDNRGSGSITPIRRRPWLAISSRTRPTVGGTTRHGSSLSQPQGALKV